MGCRNILAQPRSETHRPEWRVRAGVGFRFQARGKPGHQRAAPVGFAAVACSRALTRAARRCRGGRTAPGFGDRRRANRRRRRIARNWVRTRRAICAASLGAISPRATAARTVDSTCLQSSPVRNELRSIPRCSAGSIGARGGNNCLASGRSRCGLRVRSGCRSRRRRCPSRSRCRMRRRARRCRSSSKQQAGRSTTWMT